MLFYSLLSKIKYIKNLLHATHIGSYLFFYLFITALLSLQDLSSPYRDLNLCPFSGSMES